MIGDFFSLLPFSLESKKCLQSLKMQEPFNTKRALKHLQRAQSIMQYGPKLLSEGSLQFGTASRDKGKAPKAEHPSRRGGRVYIKAIFETVPGTYLSENPLESRSVTRDVINTNTDFQIQAIDISHEEVAYVEHNTLTIKIYTESVHNRDAMRELENQLEMKCVGAFMPEVHIFNVHIYTRNDHLHAQGGWDWSRMGM